LDLDKFAKLWAACEHEHKATVTTNWMEVSGVVGIFVNKCHMAVVQATGRHCVSTQLFFYCKIRTSLVLHAFSSHLLVCSLKFFI